MATAAEMVTAIDEAISGVVTDRVSSYSINGRSLVKLSITELLAARGYYAKIAASESTSSAPRIVEFQRPE